MSGGENGGGSVVPCGRHSHVSLDGHQSGTSKENGKMYTLNRPGNRVILKEFEGCWFILGSHNANNQSGRHLLRLYASGGEEEGENYN
uniref:Uncharacterized protein n=1 Tax=Arion vulgaris TaxID=1028688 RepID=A0A0B6ZWL4_9EUPU